MRYTDEQIYGVVRDAIARTRQISPEDVGPDAELARDLGLTSLDFVDLGFQLECHFKVKFHPVGLVEKLSELLPGAPLSERGRLTELGADLLRRRMPEVNPSRIAAGMPVSEIEQLYTPATWVRAIRELLDARPERCPGCGGDDLRAARRSILICNRCQAELVCPTQEQTLTLWARRIALASDSPGPLVAPGDLSAGEP